MAAFRNSILAGLQLVRAAIQSFNYVPNVSGWSINRDGSAEFQDAIVRGDFEANRLIARDIPSGGQVVIDPSTFDTLNTRVELTPAIPFLDEQPGFVSAQNQTPAQVPVLTLQSPIPLLAPPATIELQGQPPGGGSTSIVLSADSIGATVLNAQTLEIQGDNIGAWISWNPVMTCGGAAITIGNGSLIGRYLKQGSKVSVLIRLTLGSTTVLPAGAFEFTLPFAPSVVQQPLPVLASDVSAGLVFPCVSRLQAVAPEVQRTHAPSGAALTNAVPFAWAQNDVLSIAGSYIA